MRFESIVVKALLDGTAMGKILKDSETRQRMQIIPSHRTQILESAGDHRTSKSAMPVQ